MARRFRLTLDTATGVPVSAVITGSILHTAGLLPFDFHAAATSGVQGNGVAFGCLIVRLQDVDLAVCWPVERVGQPQRRPRTAAVRCVEDIEYE